VGWNVDGVLRDETAANGDAGLLVVVPNENGVVVPAPNVNAEGRAASVALAPKLKAGVLVGTVGRKVNGWGSDCFDISLDGIENGTEVEDEDPKENGLGAVVEAEGSGEENVKPVDNFISPLIGISLVGLSSILYS